MDLIFSITEVLVSSEIVLQKLWWFADLTQTTPDNKLSLRLKLNTGEFTHRDTFSEIIKGWVSLKGRGATIGALVAILREIECIDIAQQLEQRFATNDEISVRNVNSVNSITNGIGRNKPIGMGFTNCEKPYNFFAGRETELQYLRNAVKTPETCNLVLITGLAGIGKTEIARKFCDVYKQELEIINCLWILAEDEGVLKSQLEDVATALKLPHQSNCAKSFRSVVEKLQGQLVLIVFDNVDLRNEEVANILKEFFRKDGFVFIVTSRDKTMLEEYSPISIDLEVLPLEAAMKCVAGPLNLDLNAKDARSQIALLCEEIQCYSLALRQAVAYIQRQRKVGQVGKAFCVSHYNAKLKSADRTKLLGMEKFDHNYKSSTLKTMRVTLDHISSLENGNEAITLLRLVSYIPPENIKLEYLEKLISYYFKQQGKVLPAGENGLDAWVEILKPFCLVQSECEVLNVHRMVQEVTRYYYKDCILRDAKILYKPNFLLEGNKEHFQYSYLLNIQLNLIPFDHWRNQIFSTILKECENREFPAFLMENWRPFIYTYLYLLLPQTFDWDWILKFINVFRNIFGSLCHPAMVLMVSEFLDHSNHSERENLLETLWHDCFPFDGSVEFGISETHELFIPLHEWKHSTGILGGFLAVVAKVFEKNREWGKCLNWVPRWRLLRNLLFTDSWLSYRSTPFPIYFFVLIKLGRMGEATKLFNEECVFWKLKNCWGIVENVLIKVHEEREDGFSRVCGLHMKEHILQGMSFLSKNIPSTDYSEELEMVGKYFQRVIAYYSHSLSSCFRGDKVFCKVVNEIKCLLESSTELELDRLFDNGFGSQNIIDKLHEMVVTCSEEEVE